MMYGYDIKKYLLRLWIWIKSWGNTRGFGVQSPWAYQFIRYVICEKCSYYAYEALSKMFPDTDELTRRLSELYFRIANYSQARTWCFCLDQCDIKAAYVKQGCRTSRIVKCIDGCSAEGPFQSDVLVMTLDGDWKKFFTMFVSQLQSTSILIIEDIHVSKKALNAWRWMQNNERTGVSFDLYYCGLIFFDKKMYKQHYMVNL
ncbi:MAG: hypothetical protein ACOYJK_07190 [Prevotella sp.]